MTTGERPQAATKRGRRTLLAGVVAVALLGGMTVSVASAGVAGATVVTRHIEVCKAGPVAGLFSFTVNGTTTFSLTSGHCRTVAATAETNTVTEALDSTGATHLASIALVPSTAGTTSVSTRTAHITVAANTTVTATFTNQPSYGYLKVCKVAGTSNLLGHSFSFTESTANTSVGPFAVTAASTPDTNCGGLTKYQVGTRVNIVEAATAGVTVSNVGVTGGSLASWSGQNATAIVGPSTVTTVVNYTNSSSITQPPGAIEICKQAGDSYVNGWFNFELSQGEWSTTTSVLTGQCTGDIPVPAGQVTVTEEPSSPYYVSSVAAIPQGALVAENLANQTATFSVASQSATTAIFTNSTELGYVKVCKTLQDENSSALTGSVFTFNVADAAGTQTESVVAGPPGTTACTLDLTALPVGSTATVTEVAQPNVAVTGVSIYPASAGTVSGSSAALTVSGTGVVSATFTNEALGWVEVCKNAADPSTGQQIFPFTVNGGPVFTVAAGQCSQPFQVPAGTAIVNEIQANPNFYLANVSTVSASDPSGSRLESCSTCDPAYVSVPYGGVGNETLVTFTDAVRVGQFKVCTQQTSPDANLAAGQPFVFTYSYTVNGTTTTGTVTLTNPTSGANCSAISGYIPVVNANGSAVTVSVSEQQPTTAAVELTNVQYAGNGSVISSPPVPTTSFPATLVFSNGAGINVATFTQGRTP